MTTAHHAAVAAPSVWSTPWPWLLVAVVVLLAAGVLYAVVYDPPGVYVDAAPPGYVGRRRATGDWFVDRQPAPAPARHTRRLALTAGGAR